VNRWTHLAIRALGIAVFVLPAFLALLAPDTAVWGGKGGHR